MQILYSKLYDKIYKLTNIITNNMKHELFQVGSYDYSDLDQKLNKPVEWTEDDLKSMAETYRGGIPLTSEHDNIYVGIGNNISYEDGKLFIEVSDDLDMEDKGLSPKIDVLLKDNGDSFGIDKMNLIDVGVTKNPRKIRLLNSEISGNAGDAGNTNHTPTLVNNNDESNVATNLLLEKMQTKEKEIAELKTQIANLKKENNEYDEIKKSFEENKEFLDSKDELMDELNKLRKAENERRIKEYEEKYNFNYAENPQDKEVIDKLLSGNDKS